jgi:hypothetical protein
MRERFALRDERLEEKDFSPMTLRSLEGAGRVQVGNDAEMPFMSIQIAVM